MYNYRMEFIIFQIMILLASVVIHEVSHGYAALKLGDPTAKMAGRLTLNPIKHLDPVGSFIVPALLVFLFGFAIGWAKPVPYNPNLLFRDYKYGPLKVALAGPLSNIVIALVFGLFLRFAHSMLNETAVFLFGLIVVINVLLAVFNLIPIPPLDGSKVLAVLLPERYSMMIQQFGLGGIVFVFLFVFLFSHFLVSAVFFLSEVLIGSGAWRIFYSVF